MDFSKEVNKCLTLDSELVFTRYLYIKEEVRIALLVSILNKSDDSIFWAYELYYSGFKYELLNLIWKIYYDFFATLNPAYETYLLKKYKELLLDANQCQSQTISSIIQDLLFRPFNSDVFIQRNICENFMIDIIYYHDSKIITNMIDFHQNMIEWIAKNDFRSISQWVLNLNKGIINVVDIYNICLDIFYHHININKNKLAKDFEKAITLDINKNVILLSKIMTLFSKKANLKNGKSIYINVEPEDIIPYESMVGSNNQKAYRILETAYMCGIDDFKHLSLFKLTRDKYKLKEEYWYHWEYYASFSPLWFQRMQQFKGYLDYMNKKVLFEDDPENKLMDEFYSLYGLEPDEQKIEVQNKSTMPIKRVYNWKWFIDQYRKNGLFEVYDEELEEFDVDGVIY